MAEVIQFNCPVCGTLLRLPLDLAAQKGPCPTCQREIIAPDPFRGIGAFEAPDPRSFPRDEPFRPFVDSPPVEPSEAKPEPGPALPVAKEIEVPMVLETPPPEPVVVAETKVSPEPKPPLVRACLFTFLVAIIMGYAIGVRSNQYSTGHSPPAPVNTPVVETVTKPAVVEPPAPKPEPTPIFVKPIIQEPPPKPEPPKVEVEQKQPEPVKPPDPVKVSAAAEASLRAFLEAPDWATRNAHVLFPEAVRSAMETYSHEAPDGPATFKSIAVKQSQTDEKTGNTLFVFMVETGALPVGIPVAVAETPQGWLVDWRAFAEFRDDLFKKFADGPTGKTGSFHLIVSTPPPDRAASTENQHFASFLLDPPIPGRQQLAFVKKNSEAYRACLAATASGGIFTPVLEVTKLATPDKQTYLEILKIHAGDWLPREK
ncbi:MAG: hypothetical protein ABIT37_05725 [Luteolibacter sp.]